MNPSDVENLACVQVADARHDLLIEQQHLDRPRALGAAFPPGLKRHLQRVRPQGFGRKRAFQLAGAKQPDGAQPALIPKPDGVVFRLTGKLPFNPQMDPVRRIRQQHQTGHPRLDYHGRVVRDAKHNPLPQAANCINPPPFEAFGEKFESRPDRYGLARAATTHERRDRPPLDERADAADHGFDFGKLWHLRSLWFFAIDLETLPMRQDHGEERPLARLKPRFWACVRWGRGPGQVPLSCRYAKGDVCEAGQSR